MEKTGKVNYFIDLSQKNFIFKECLQLGNLLVVLSLVYIF